MWRSWLAHHVRDVGVGRSSRLIPTKGVSRNRRPLFVRYIIEFREVAQLASALRSGRRGRVFESPLPDKKGS